MSMIYIWISLFLFICLLTDLFYAKIFNQFIIASLVFSMFLILALPNNNIYWFHPPASFLSVFVLGLLLFKFKILGAGDVKAMLVVSLFLTPYQSMMFLAYSILWGGVFSVVYFLVRGSLFNMIYTTAGVFRRVSYAVHKIPFTVGILLGWLSLIVSGLY